MGIAGPAGAGTHGQTVSRLGLAAGGQRGHLLVTHAAPGDRLLPAQAFGQAVERVTGQPPDVLYAGAGQRSHQHVGNTIVGHDHVSL